MESGKQSLKLTLDVEQSIEKRIDLISNKFATPEFLYIHPNDEKIIVNKELYNNIQFGNLDTFLKENELDEYNLVVVKIINANDYSIMKLISVLSKKIVKMGYLTLIINSEDENLLKSVLRTTRTLNLKLNHDKVFEKSSSSETHIIDIYK